MKINKILFVAILSIFSLQLFAQCEECTSFEEAFKEPSMVKTLKISPWVNGVTLETIPLEIAQLTKLKVLYLSDHEISAIPAEISELKKLKEMSFAGCNLTSIPDEIYQMKNLKEVILLSNPFSDEMKETIKKRFEKELPKTSLLIN